MIRRQCAPALHARAIRGDPPVELASSPFGISVGISIDVSISIGVDVAVGMSISTGVGRDHDMRTQIYEGNETPRSP